VLLEQNGFDRLQHEHIRAELKEGRIGLAQNRLPPSAVIEPVRSTDVVDVTTERAQGAAALGLEALRNGELAIVTLAAGAGSRWTQGAGVVKALHPFCKLAGKHRTFVEAHLAKSRRISRQAGMPVAHIFTTSYLTHAPTEEFLARHKRYGYPGPVLLSPAKSVGLRLIPTVRDLRF
jgi:UDP-N-acetylglucosamine pyrophosphorylase